MKHQKKMIKKYDARQKDYQATIKGAKDASRYTKPGSRKL